MNSCCLFDVAVRQNSPAQHPDVAILPPSSPAQYFAIALPRTNCCSQINHNLESSDDESSDTDEVDE